MKHYDFEISLFVDNELDEEMQREMFEHLAKCGECRKTVQGFLGIKKEVNNYYGSMPAAPVPVLSGGAAHNNSRSTIYAFSAAASLIIVSVLFLAYYISSKASYENYENKIVALASTNAVLNSKLKSTNVQELPRQVAEPVKEVKSAGHSRRVNKKAIKKNEDIRNNNIERKFTGSQNTNMAVREQVTDADYFTIKLTGN
ncbi:MAG: zf-HC2 domain-containing protein [Bacteroidota bacterium]|nr:zf-HC2 domain-containing protein [Bacteroidota bacterium]